MIIYIFTIIFLNFNIYASENISEIEEEEWTDLRFQTLLIEKNTYIDKLNEDYFVLNKKRIDENKEKEKAVEIMKKEHEESILVISRRASNSKEKLKKSKEENRLSQEKINNIFKKNEELEQEKNESFELIHKMEKKIEELEKKNKEYLESINQYKPYKIFFNPARRYPHKVISNQALEEQNWLLTDYQAYIITHLIDNEVQLKSKRI